jgi:hypothetical protein
VITRSPIRVVTKLNIFNSNYLLSRLRKGQKSFDGGVQIAIPIEYDELTSGGSFSGLELLDTAVNDVATLAQYDWRQYYVTVGWSRSDYLKNKGSKTQIVNMVSMLTQNASKKMQKQLTTGIFQTTKAASSDIDGLVVATVAASTTDCGGLDSNDFATWAAQRDTTTTKLSLAAMNALYRDAMDGPDAPTIVVTTDDILGFYYDIATPLQRYQNADAASQGFTSLSFNGIPVVSDKACTTNYLFMLNENHLWLAAHSDEDMRYKKPQEPLNQAAELGQIFWMGNLITDARRRQAVMTGITS